MLKVMLLALRNLTRHGKRNVLLGSAIAIGIMVTTLINGTTGGFIKSAGDNFSHLLAGHLFIEGRELTQSNRIVPRLGDGESLIRVVEQAGIPVESVHLRSSFMGELIFEGATLTLRVEGVRWDEEIALMSRLALRDGSWDNVDDPRAIVLSQETAESLGAVVGDLVLVQLETATGQQNVGEFVVAAITFDPGLLSTVSAYASVDLVNRLLNLPDGEYMKLSVMLRDIRLMERYAERLSDQLANDGYQLFPRLTPSLGMGLFDVSRSGSAWEGVKYQVSTLGDYLSQLSQIINILNILGWGILAILLVIIMTGITNTYRMIMYERTREIGTMRALGMQRSGVRMLFLFEAAFLGFLGSLAGILAAFLVMTGFSFVQWGLDSPLFLFLSAGRMRFSLPAWQLVLNTAVVVIICIAGATGPASRAASLEPGFALGKTY